MITAERKAQADFWEEVHEYRQIIREKNLNYKKLLDNYAKALRKEKKNIPWLTALAEEIKIRRNGSRINE